jgi:hypothetical protein
MKNLTGNSQPDNPPSANGPPPPRETAPPAKGTTSLLEMFLGSPTAAAEARRAFRLRRAEELQKLYKTIRAPGGESSPKPGPHPANPFAVPSYPPFRGPDHIHAQASAGRTDAGVTAGRPLRRKELGELLLALLRCRLPSLVDDLLANILERLVARPDVARALALTLRRAERRR